MPRHVFVVFTNCTDGLNSVLDLMTGTPTARFLEIGTDEDHVHFLVQSVPTYSRVETRSDGEEPDGARDLSTVPAGKEATVARRILVGRLLRQHGWQTRRRGDD